LKNVNMLHERRNQCWARKNCAEPQAYSV